MDGDREEDVAEEPGYRLTATASSPTHLNVFQLQTGVPETNTPRYSRPSVSRTTSQNTGITLRSPGQISHLQSANNSAPSQGPIESAIWDWQASSPKVPTRSEASLASKTTPAYSYEPQGELLLQYSRLQGAVEFNIPAPVLSASATTRQHRNPLEALLGDGTSPTRNRGAKRKSAPDLFPSSQLESGGAKRFAVDLGDDRPADFEQRVLPPSRASGPSIQMALPARKVFPIQIGDKLFRLSGASISSDAPSYFSQFFQEQLKAHRVAGDTSSSSNSSSAAIDASSVRTLYIDRDPATFCDISLHLQGYHIEPSDGSHFVKLLADAQFFSLPRLTSQLTTTSPLHTTIGSTPFAIPRDLFTNSPGNSPNYFTLASQLFTTNNPSEAYSGLSQRSLLRPSALSPLCVPSRDAETFADLVRLLKGYEVEVRSEEHRRMLMRDARYYCFRGVEQRLVRCRISTFLNSSSDGVREEIEIGLEDAKSSGISFVEGVGGDEIGKEGVSGEVQYARPYVDDAGRRLILEIGGDSVVRLVMGCDGRTGRVEFWGKTAAKMKRLVGVVGVRTGLLLPGSEGDQGVPFGVRCTVDNEADVSLDGKKWNVDDGRDAVVLGQGESGCMVKRSQWRIKAGACEDGKLEVNLEAVKIEAYNFERARTEDRGFL